MGLAHEKKNYLQEKANLFEIGSHKKLSDFRPKPHAPFVWHTMPWNVVIASRKRLIIRSIFTDYLAVILAFSDFPASGDGDAPNQPRSRQLQMWRIPGL